MKRIALFFFVSLFLAPGLSAQDFDPFNCTVVVAGEFGRGTRKIGNGVFVRHNGHCCLVTANHLLALNGSNTPTVEVLIGTNPVLSLEQVSERLGNGSGWRYHAGAIATKVYGYNFCFFDSRIDIRGISVEFPEAFLQNGLILTRPVEFEELADDSLLMPGKQVATVGLLFNPASRLILPMIDTGRVVSHMGNELHYSGKGIQGMSGSPVWMMSGGRIKLVGIHSYHTQEYESYAIKASVIKSHMK